jgi:hypothetical protein
VKAVVPVTASDRGGALSVGTAESDGTLTLPALTFVKAGNYPVKLSLGNGSTRYMKFKVKKG